jgi:uncharacterized integral membrane protein
MTEPLDPAQSSTPPPASGAPAEPGRPGIGDRIQEGRRTFQPGLWARITLLALVLLYLILFVVENSRQVKVNFVVTSTRVSLIWVIVLSLLIGLILGVLASQVRRFRSHRRHAAREQARA